MDVPALEPHEAALLMRLAQIAGQGSERLEPLFDPEFPGVLFAGRRDPGKEPISPEAVHSLGRLGLVEIEPSSRRLGPFRISKLGYVTAEAAVTSAGASYHERQRSGEDGPVDLSWDVVGPIAEGIYRLHSEHGASRVRRGINGDAARVQLAPESSDAAFAAQLRALRDRDWIIYRNEVGPPIPNGIAPAARAIAFFGGWPDGGNDEAITNRLVAALDERIKESNDPEEKSKLQGLRKAIGDVSRTVVAGLLLEAGKGAI